MRTQLLRIQLPSPIPQLHTPVPLQVPLGELDGVPLLLGVRVADAVREALRETLPAGKGGSRFDMPKATAKAHR